MIKRWVVQGNGREGTEVVLTLDKEDVINMVMGRSPGVDRMGHPCIKATGEITGNQHSMRWVWNTEALNTLDFGELIYLYGVLTAKTWPLWPGMSDTELKVTARKAADRFSDVRWAPRTKETILKDVQNAIERVRTQGRV